MEMVNLTSVERKLLAELALGFSNTHIAERLSYTKESVDTSAKRLYDKLDIPIIDSVNRRAFAIRIFYRGEYISGDDAEA